MDGLQKVLVVDNGDRPVESSLSAELAGMGLASVTATVEAADDILALLPSPAAVVLQIPKGADWAERKRFLDLAERLRTSLRGTKVPVIVFNGAAGNGANSLLLQSELGTRVLSQAEL
jgi:hypothetical protein